MWPILTNMLRIHRRPQKFGIKACCCMILWPPSSFSSVLFALALCIKVVYYAQSPHFCRIWERSWWAVLPPIFFLKRLIPGLKPTTCHLCAWFVKNMIRLIFQLLAAFHFSSYFTVYMLF